MGGKLLKPKHPPPPLSGENFALLRAAEWDWVGGFASNSTRYDVYACVVDGRAYRIRLCVASSPSKRVYHWLRIVQEVARLQGEAHVTIILGWHWLQALKLYENSPTRMMYILRGINEAI